MIRTAAAIKAEFANLVELQHDTERQLEDVRRDILKLQHHELVLCNTRHERGKKIDRVLDERNDVERAQWEAMVQA